MRFPAFCLFIASSTFALEPWADQKLPVNDNVLLWLDAARQPAARDARKTPTVEASEYKLYTTELSRRLADATMDIAGPGSQLALGTADAPLKGRAESCYTYTVIDTIGGGSSEVQKNIIATRKLGLPRNF